MVKDMGIHTDLDLQERHERHGQWIVMAVILFAIAILGWVGFIYPSLPDSFEFTVNTQSRGPITYICTDLDHNRHYVCKEKSQP